MLKHGIRVLVYVMVLMTIFLVKYRAAHKCIRSMMRLEVGEDVSLNNRLVNLGCVDRIVFLPVVNSDNVRHILMSNVRGTQNVSLVSIIPRPTDKRVCLSTLLRDLLVKEFPLMNHGTTEVFIDVARSVFVTRSIRRWWSVDIAISIILDDEFLTQIDPDASHVLVPNYLLTNALERGVFAIDLPLTVISTMYWSQEDAMSMWSVLAKV